MEFTCGFAGSFGIKGAMSLEIQKIVIEGDNLVVIHASKTLCKFSLTINPFILNVDEDLF